MSPTAAAVGPGQSIQFNAIVNDSSNSTVTWAVNGVVGGNTEYGTISASGVYTAPMTGLPSPASGNVAVLSAHDNLLLVLDATTLKVNQTITLPGTPVNIVADKTDGVAIIGNADQVNAGGTFSKVDLANGTATIVPSIEATVMPVGMVTAATGKGLAVCPQDGVSPCTSFILP
jgi:hypothetical protein